MGLMWKFYHITEAFVFLDYIFVLLLHDSCSEEFENGIGKYKTQIPSAKICVVILLFVSAIAFGIGCLTHANEIKLFSGKKMIRTLTPVSQAILTLLYSEYGHYYKAAII